MITRVTRITIVLIFILVASAEAQAQQQTGYQGSPSITSAKDLYNHGRYDEARNMLDALISSGVRSAEVLYYRGLVEPIAAVAVERYFDEITRRFPRGEIADLARFRIAQYRYDTGLYVTARKIFSEVAWSQGDSPLGQAARYWRGMTWIYSIGSTRGTQPDSIRIGLRIIKGVASRATDPDIRGKALTSIGELSLELNQPDSTIAYASELLEAPYLNAYHPHALLLHAKAYEVKADSDQARSIYQIIATRYSETWTGREARRWLVGDRERTVQARLDSTLATGAAAFDPEGAGEGRWSVQVGAFSNMANATQRVIQLSEAGYTAWHTSKRVEGNVYVVVLVGRFPTRAEANAFGNEMVQNSVIPSFQTYQLPPP